MNELVVSYLPQQAGMAGSAIDDFTSNVLGNKVRVVMSDERLIEGEL